MSLSDPQDFGQWQTAARLLASLVNDGLLATSPAMHPSAPEQEGLLLHGKSADTKTAQSSALWIGLSQPGRRLLSPSSAATIAAFPGDFTLPIIMTTYGVQAAQRELDPATVMTHVRDVLAIEPIEDKLWDQVCFELTNSAVNQQHWFEWAQKRRPLSLQSPQLEWEQSCYTGHPLHPMHRSLSTQAPLPEIAADQVSTLMKHSVSFISVPGHDVRISGPFRQIMKSLLAHFGLSSSEPGRVVLPCITMQIPVIKQHHEDVDVVRLDAFDVHTQSSMRTVTIPFFEYDLKFALDVKIGSALRTITPWTSCIVSELSMVLNEILPSSLWLMDDIAAVTGSGDFDRAKHISCIVRRNMQQRAFAADETMLVAGALQEIPPGASECNAALVYKLKTEADKMAWFSEYTEGIINAFMAPVVDHGVAFEAHAQNVLVRADRATGALKGFATRDLGSIKIHMPTLARSGYELFSAMDGSFVSEQSEEAMWRIIQFCLFQNNLNVFIYRLGVDRAAAWAMIREKLLAFLDTRKHAENTQRLKEFLFAETIPQKAFMVMKFAQKARTYDYVNVSNVLLEGMNA